MSRKQAKPDRGGDVSTQDLTPTIRPIDIPPAFVEDVRMLGKALGGLAGLGLIGGTGTVIYNGQGDATVKIKNEKTGIVQSVRIEGADGTSFLCPLGTDDKLEPHVIAAGRIKLTLRQVRRQEHAIERQYPSRRAPGSVVDRFNRLKSRDDRLVDAYNAEVRTHNAIISRDCTRG